MGSEMCIRDRPWGMRTYFFRGGALRKSIKVTHTAKGVRVVTGSKREASVFWYASIAHAATRTTRNGRKIKGNPYLWKARDATRHIVEFEVEKVLNKYIAIVDRRAVGKGP